MQSKTIDGNKIIVYAVPIYVKEKIIGTVFATHKFAAYQDALSEAYVYKNGQFIVLDTKSNQIIFDSLNLSNYTDTDHFFSAIVPENEEKMTQMENDLQNGKSDSILCSYEDLQKYMTYTPIGINDWYLLSILPANILTDKFDYVITSNLYVCLSISLVFFLLTIYILFSQCKSRGILYHLAFYDEVTGGYNLNRFTQKAKQLLSAKSDKKYAMIRFDIEKFKYVNDMFGYKVGDLTLQNVSNMFYANVSDDECFSRISNDDYIALLHYTTQTELEKWLSVLSRSVAEAQHEINNHFDLVLCFGIYFIEEKSSNITSFSDKAGIAHKSGKGFHSTNFTYYNDTIREQIILEKEIENQMADALKKGEFVVYMQPKYNLKSLEIVSAEALIRWQHPEKGLIPPMHFIPLFEKNGFIVNLDMYVFEQVCQSLKKWIDSSMRLVPISVNISRVHLYDRKFIATLKRIIDDYHIPASLIELELTESVVFDNVDILFNIMRELKEIGFIISMDDFGSGYSSLNLLKELPVDVMKIDREFFRETTDNERGKKVIYAIVALAKSIDMQVVSEGVETEEQASFLRQIGCDMAQGYLFAKPMPTADFEILLEKSSDISQIQNNS